MRKFGKTNPIKHCEIISYWPVVAFYTFKLSRRPQGTQEKCSTCRVQYGASCLTWQGRVDAQPKFILGGKEKKMSLSCVAFAAFLLEYVARILTGFAFSSCCMCNNPLQLLTRFGTNKVHFSGCDRKSLGSYFGGFIHNFPIRP